METTNSDDALKALEPLVGNWTMVPTFEGLPPSDIGAPISFEWLSGGRFLIERWEVPVSEAPDGIAIIGVDPESEPVRMPAVIGLARRCFPESGIGIPCPVR